MIDLRPAHPFLWTEQPWGPALQSAVLARVAGHLFTTRDLPLRGDGAASGWARLAAWAGVPPDRLMRLKQVHGVDVAVVRADAVAWSSSDDGWPRADIIMTDDPTVALAVQTADCVPLLLADPATGAVAAVHGGWRGTAAGVARTAVSAMREHFGVRAADLVAAIGPSIGVCCYQVGPDVRAAFCDAGFSEEDLRSWFRPDESAPAGPRYRFDVPKAIRDQLRAAGVADEHIAASGLCTACHPALFPSYRRDGAHTGRIAGVIRPGGVQ